VFLKPARITDPPMAVPVDVAFAPTLAFGRSLMFEVTLRLPSAFTVALGAIEAVAMFCESL
jgi:hypothetical protein